MKRGSHSFPSCGAISRCPRLPDVLPLTGTDFTPEDSRFGFDSDLAAVQAKFEGSRRILALVDARLPEGRFPNGYDMPLGWPQPSWGKWQLRDVDVISVSRIPSRAAGYCYGRRVIYVDRATSAPLWEELYDSKLSPGRSTDSSPHD